MGEEEGNGMWVRKMEGNGRMIERRYKKEVVMLYGNISYISSGHS